MLRPPADHIASLPGVTLSYIVKDELEAALSSAPEVTMSDLRTRLLGDYSFPSERAKASFDKRLRRAVRMYATTGAIETDTELRDKNMATVIRSRNPEKP